LGTVFGFADLTMGLLAVVNLWALWALYPIARRLLANYEEQRAGGTPVFVLNQLPDLDLDEASWGTPADPEKTG
jgi:AGCS family alanine or glycine:cation symporter